MTKVMRGLTFFLTLLGIVYLVRFPVQAGNDLTDYLPTDAKILQIVTDKGFDLDPGEEMLVLIEQGTDWYVYLMNPVTYGYEQIYRVDLGRAGYFRCKGLQVNYNVLQTGDVNADGVTDFWLVFSPGEQQGELQVYVSHRGTYQNVAEVRADVDLQFMNYRGERVIHEVNQEEIPEVRRNFFHRNTQNEAAGQGVIDQHEGPFYLVKSHVWRDGRFVLEEQEYRFTVEDYLLFADSRWRPQIFTGRNQDGHLKYRFGESLLLKDIPMGRVAIEELLPAKAFLLDYLPDAALDLDTDVEYLLAYLVPDPEDGRQVLFQAGIADWSAETGSYRLSLLDCKNYGLARYPEGRFYRPIYLLPGEGLSHPVVVGNAASDKPMLQMTAFANNGDGFSTVASIQANYYLWFTENGASDGLFYRIIAADLRKDGKVAVKHYHAKAEQAYGAYGSFYLQNETAMSLREFKLTHYRSEETEWTSEGYEAPILRTNPQKTSAFTGALPNANSSVVDLESYLARNLGVLRIRSWLAEDLNNDGEVDHLALFRTDDQGWPPQYRLGYLFQNGGRLELQPVGSPLRLDDGEPAAGVYLVDVDPEQNDGRELVLIRRSLNAQMGRRSVNVEMYKLTNRSWVRIHNKEIWFDQIKLFLGPSGVELVGFLLDVAGRPQGNVYELIWEDGAFQLRKKVSVLSFRTYLGRMEEKTLLLQPDDAVFHLR